MVISGCDTLRLGAIILKKRDYDEETPAMICLRRAVIAGAFVFSIINCCELQLEGDI